MSGGEILQDIRTGFANASPLDLANLVLGVVGVWLMVRRSLWAFPVGLVAVCVQAKLFWDLKFYADAKLQGFFFACLLCGWWHWVRGRGAAPELPVSTLGWRARALGAGAALALMLGWGRYQQLHTDAAMPYRDTFIAAFSILAQIWQARKHLENWPVWVAVNAVAVASYWTAGAYFTAALYGIFLAMGVSGWLAWGRALRAQVCVAGAAGEKGKTA